MLKVRYGQVMGHMVVKSTKLLSLQNIQLTKPFLLQLKTMDFINLLMVGILGHR